jgi:hypothetical protein
VSDNDPAEDRDWALRLIDSLAVPPPPPRQWSALYHEAGAIHAGSYRTGDSVLDRRQPHRPRRLTRASR